jgi:hypothetical protein
MGMTRTASRQAEILTAMLCFLAPLVAYTLTSARTVQAGDSPEFAMLGVFGGVAHPPGYPLYTLLVRLAAQLPIEPLFFRLSLASALCGAAAVVVLQRVVLRLTSPWVPRRLPRSLSRCRRSSGASQVFRRCSH